MTKLNKVGDKDKVNFARFFARLWTGEHLQSCKTTGLSRVSTRKDGGWTRRSGLSSREVRDPTQSLFSADQHMMTKESEETGEERFKLCFILTSLVSVWWLLDKQKYWVTRKWASWWRDLWTSFPKKSYSFFEFKVSSWHLAFWGSALIDDQNEQQ